MYIYTQIIWDDSVPSKSQRPPNKNHDSSHEKPSLSCWSGLSKRFPKHTLLLFPLILPRDRS